MNESIYQSYVTRERQRPNTSCAYGVDLLKMQHDLRNVHVGVLVQRTKNDWDISIENYYYSSFAYENFQRLKKRLKVLRILFL